MDISQEELDTWRRAGLGRFVLFTLPKEMNPREVRMTIDQITQVIQENFKVAIIIDEQAKELEFFWSPLIAKHPRMVQALISLCVQEGKCKVTNPSRSILEDNKRARKILAGFNLIDGGIIPIGTPYQIPETFMAEK